MKGGREGDVREEGRELDIYEEAEERRKGRRQTLLESPLSGTNWHSYPWLRDLSDVVLAGIPTRGRVARHTKETGFSTLSLTLSLFTTPFFLA